MRLVIVWANRARETSVAKKGISKKGKYIESVVGVHMFAFLPKPIKKAVKTKRKT